MEHGLSTPLPAGKPVFDYMFSFKVPCREVSVWLKLKLFVLSCPYCVGRSPIFLATSFNFCNLECFKSMILAVLTDISLSLKSSFLNTFLYMLS